MNTERSQTRTDDAITEHAHQGVHDSLEALVRTHLPARSKVIDVGAGAGAFTRRLTLAGFNVTPCDIDPAKWSVPEVPLQVVNLNNGLEKEVGGDFDAAVCIEVIEHVENPWHLLREIRSVLRPGGLLVLSTPNVASFRSRLTFARTGRFHQFDVDDLSYGHINPMTAFHVDDVAGSTGWEIIDQSPAGYLPVFDLSASVWRGLFLGLGHLLIRTVGGPETHGWCRAWVLRRT